MKGIFLADIHFVIVVIIEVIAVGLMVWLAAWRTGFIGDEVIRENSKKGTEQNGRSVMLHPECLHIIRKQTFVLIKDEGFRL